VLYIGIDDDELLKILVEKDLLASERQGKEFVYQVK